MKELKHVKNLRLQLSKHIKLLLFLNFFLARTSFPKPKINFSNMFIDPFPFHFSTQSCFAVVSLPERALRPAQSTSRPVETTLPQRSGWFFAGFTVNLSGRSIHSQKEVFKLGWQNCLILGKDPWNRIRQYHLYISLPFCDRIHVFFLQLAVNILMIIHNSTTSGKIDELYQKISRYVYKVLTNNLKHIIEVVAAQMTSLQSQPVTWCSFCSLPPPIVWIQRPSKSQSCLRSVDLRQCMFQCVTNEYKWYGTYIIFQLYANAWSQGYSFLTVHFYSKALQSGSFVWSCMKSHALNKWAWCIVSVSFEIHIDANNLAVPADPWLWIIWSQCHITCSPNSMRSLLFDSIRYMGRVHCMKFWTWQDYQKDQTKDKFLQVRTCC